MGIAEAPGLKYLARDNYLNNAATEISSSNSSLMLYRNWFSHIFLSVA